MVVDMPYVLNRNRDWVDDEASRGDVANTHACYSLRQRDVCKTLTVVTDRQTATYSSNKSRVFHTCCGHSRE
jgi:hypothetical protein